MVCPKCCLPICRKTDTFTVCQGSCLESYHAECVGLTEASVRCISKNVIWLCDGCLAHFYKKHPLTLEDAPTKLESDMADVKEKIATIMETLTTLTPQVPMSQQKDAFNSVEGTAHHSTPISSSRLYCGSKLEDGSSIECCLETPQNVQDDSFSLFLTNINSSATEEEIGRLVAQSLELDDTQKDSFEVVKLVPNWRMHRFQRYVSFKVTMNGSFKRFALQPETWPTGIKFREFIEQPRRIWTPIRQQRSEL